MNESPGSFELLSSRVDELEKRIHALEHPAEAKVSEPASTVMQATAVADNAEASLQTTRLFPILGRALLGIAGAYVLRAVAATGVMPPVIAVVAVLYAFAWLIWAARISKISDVAALIYAGTSAAILAPMLWEITLHHVFTPMVTAGVLTAFVTLATVIGLRGGGSRFAWIAQGVGAITSVALAVATHDVMPFVIALLLTLLVVEYARSLDYGQLAWPLIALVTDGAIWGMIFIYSGPQNARQEYPDSTAAALIFPACLLFAANGSSVAIRVILQQKRIGVFDTIQAMIAFLLLISSALLFAPRNASAALGILCVTLSAAAYTASFLRLSQQADRRNFHVFAAWSATLLIAGVLWSLPQSAAGIALAIAGLVAYIVAVRIDLRILELHGVLFLAGATVISGIALYVFGTLAGPVPGRPALTVWIIAFAAVVAYTVEKDSRDDKWTGQGLHLIPAFLAVSAICALLVRGLLALATLAVSLDVHHIAFFRTFVISAVSLCLAFAGSRWGRVAMTRMAYIALAFVAAKLLFEDLRHGHMEFIAGSIFLFAITLIAVPRLVRAGAQARAASLSKTLEAIGT
jgi:hypothetical protein